MKTIRIHNYVDARAALLNRDLKQALYDEGGVVMDDVLLTLHGKAHRDRRVVEHRIFRRDFMRYYEKELFPVVVEETLAPFLAAGKADLVEFGYLVTMNLTADFAGIDRPNKNAEETESLLALVRKFSEGATLVHSTRDKDTVRAEVQVALEEFDRLFLGPSIARRKEVLEQLTLGQIGEDDLPRDILTELLRNEDTHPLTPQVLRREIAFYLQAGSHSTANATVHALHDIFCWCDMHPEDEERINEDVLFLQRCVHESLRLRPASPVAWRQPICPVTINGEVASEGDRIVLDLHMANQDESIYGKGADKFDPYREIPEGREPYGLTFGVGVHTCLGRDLDGGTAQKGGEEVEEHYYGVVTELVRTLLSHGAYLIRDDMPTEDMTTERHVWGRYPVTFSKP